MRGFQPIPNGPGEPKPLPLEGLPIVTTGSGQCGCQNPHLPLACERCGRIDFLATMERKYLELRTERTIYLDALWSIYEGGSNASSGMACAKHAIRAIEKGELLYGKRP